MGHTSDSPKVDKESQKMEPVSRRAGIKSGELQPTHQMAASSGGAAKLRRGWFGASKRRQNARSMSRESLETVEEVIDGSLAEISAKDGYAKFRTLQSFPENYSEVEFLSSSLNDGPESYGGNSGPLKPRFNLPHGDHGDIAPAAQFQNVPLNAAPSAGFHIPPEPPEEIGKPPLPAGGLPGILRQLSLPKSRSSDSLNKAPISTPVNNSSKSMHLPYPAKAELSPTTALSPSSTASSTKSLSLLSPTGSESWSQKSGKSSSSGKGHGRYMNRSPKPRSSKYAMMFYEKPSVAAGDFLGVVADMSKQQERERGEIEKKEIERQRIEIKEKERQRIEMKEKERQRVEMKEKSAGSSAFIDLGNKEKAEGEEWGEQFEWSKEEKSVGNREFIDSQRKHGGRSSADKEYQKTWSWKKMGFKKMQPAPRTSSSLSSTSWGKQDEMVQQLELRLDKASATPSSTFQDRSPLEDAAFFQEESFLQPQSSGDSVELLTDLPPELAMPSLDPTSFRASATSASLSPLPSPSRGVTVALSASGSFWKDSTDASSQMRLRRAAFGSGVSNQSQLLVDSAEGALEMSRQESVTSSLLKELEKMRLKAETAEKARQQAENKAQSALAEAERSIREAEKLGRSQKQPKSLLPPSSSSSWSTSVLETATSLETATREAAMAMKVAEEARQSALAESKNVEEALQEAAQMWASLEAEAKRRQKIEAEAHSQERARANLKNYRQYSWEELQAATENFKPERKIGEGGFGTVYGGVLNHTPVAIKVLKNGDGLQAAVEFKQEIEVLGELRHPHIMMLLGCCPEKYCLVYEFMANGSLEDRLSCLGGTPPLAWFVRLRIVAEIASALLELHTRPIPIVHRDLKPANILLDKNFVAKLGDVGLAKIMPSNGDAGQTFACDSRPVGTLAYVDPEFQRTGEYGPKSDVYAFGIVLFDVLTGRKPSTYEAIEDALDDGDMKRLADYLDPAAGEWPIAVASEVAKLAVCCSEMKRKKRPALETIVMPVLDKIRTYAVAAEEDSLKRRGVGSNAPSCLFCPITQEMMVDPVIASDGHTYETKAIQHWLLTSDHSPMTNQKLPNKDLVPNHAVRTMISEWKDAQGH